MIKLNFDLRFQKFHFGMMALKNILIQYEVLIHTRSILAFSQRSGAAGREPECRDAEQHEPDDEVLLTSLGLRSVWPALEVDLFAACGDGSDAPARTKPLHQGQASRDHLNRTDRRHPYADHVAAPANHAGGGRRRGD